MWDERKEIEMNEQYFYRPLDLANIKALGFAVEEVAIRRLAA